MARGNFMQSSFLGGEWSPLSQGRTDEKEYYTALNLALNFIPTDEGALSRRSGARFSAHAKDSSGYIKLLTFVSESSDALVVELTDQLLRFHARGTLLTDDRVDVVSVTAATPGVVTTNTAHGWDDGDTVTFVSPDMPFPVAVRNKQFVIANKTADTFELKNTGPLGTGDADGTELNSILADGFLLQVGRVEERVVPYLDTELADVLYTEEEDTLYLFHENHEPNLVERIDLVVDEMEFVDGPYLDQNETAVTLGFSGTTGSITVTASSTTAINGGQGFLATDVGRLIRVNSGSEDEPDWTWLKITAHTSTTVVTATVMGEDLAGTTAVTTWRLGLYSDTTGWPTHGVVHEGRLWLVSNVRAGRVDGSRSGGLSGARFNDFTPTEQDGTVADSHGIAAIFAGSGRQNAKWLQSIGTGLLVGTDGGEYIVRASSFDDPLSPFSIQVRRHTSFGSATVLPARAGKVSLFVQELGRSVMEYRDVGGGQYDGNDIARSARHLTTEGIIDVAYQKIPNPVLWCLRGDNRIIGCTYRDDLAGRQVAWHRHSIEYTLDVAKGEDADGRFLRGGRTKSTGTARSITTAPFSDPAGTRNDNLWVAVDREGTTCIEYFTPLFDVSFAQNEGFFVDSGNIYYKGDQGINWEVTGTAGGNATVRFYGLDRLEGKSVDGMFRGFDIGSTTVASGYADFTFDEDLLDEAAAIELVVSEQIATTSINFNSQYVSNVNASTPNSLGYPHAQSTIITGEDGNQYFISGGVAGTGGDGDTLTIRDASDCSVAITKSVSTMSSDAVSAGVVASPDFSLNGAIAAVNIPDTPYIAVICTGTFSGTSSGKKILYYRINSAGSLVLDGGYAGRTGGLDVQSSPPDAAGNAYVGAGHVIASPTTGVNNAVAYKYPYAVAYYGESRSTVMVIPSINHILANIAVSESATDHWRVRELSLGDTAFGVNSFAITDTPVGAGQKSRMFFLPRKEGRGSHATMNFFLADLEAHAAGSEGVTNTFLDTNASTYVTGLMSSFPLTVNPGINAFGYNKSVDGAVTIARHGSFDVFPFPDEKEDFDGNAGSADDNFYGQPTVYPFDPDDASKPWLLFFPRLYRESGDRDKIGIRIYEWNPLQETARFITFSKGQVYDIGTDVDSDTNPTHASVTWDRGTGELLLYIGSTATGERQQIIARFGYFSPVLEPASLVDERHIDAVVGCNYYSRAQLLRPDFGAGAQSGPGLGKLRRVDQYAVLTYSSGETYIGTNFDTMFTVNYENPEGLDAYGRAPLFSQVAHGSLQSTYDFDNLMAWEVRRPVPGNYVSAAGFSNMSDR